MGSALALSYRYAIGRGTQKYPELMRVILFA